MPVLTPYPPPLPPKEPKQNATPPPPPETPPPPPDPPAFSGGEEIDDITALILGSAACLSIYWHAGAEFSEFDKRQMRLAARQLWIISLRMEAGEL